MQSHNPLKLGVLISGRGSNLKALHQAIQSKKLDAKIEVVLSDNPQASGLAFAESQGIPHQAIERKPGENRQVFEKKLTTALNSYLIEVIVLAGFMKLLSPDFVESYPLRIVNIHPSLLPAFPGLNAQKQAIDAGVRFSGCTVHFVDEGCDTGPIIDQRVVPVHPDDDANRLAQRILVEEHQLYPSCLQKIAKRKLKVVGKKVSFI